MRTVRAESPAANPRTTPAAAQRLATLLSHLPENVMAAYIARPSPRSGSGPSALERLSFLIQQGQRIGLLPVEGKALADILASLPLLGSYAHAVALLDITSRALPRGGYRLNDMQLVLLFHTAGDNAPITNRIQSLLASYTSPEFSRIETVTEGPSPYHRLRDRRLPEWAVFEWGSVGDLYVTTFGQGAFDRVLAVAGLPADSLRTDEWFRSAHQKCKGPIATLECVLNLRQLVERVEEVVPERPREVLGAFHAQEARRLVWTVGRVGRVLTSYAMIQVEDDDVFIPLSDPALFQPHQVAAVPEQAHVYAVVPFDLAAWVPAVRDGYLASQSPSNRQQIEAAWARIESDLGLDIEKDLLGKLGNQVIIHTYPPHPAGVPLLCTLLVEIRQNAPAVRRRLERLLARWQKYLALAARETDNPLFALRVKKTEDDIWYLQAGLNGPGLAVVDSWIVISYSAEAVRANVAFLHEKYGISASAPSASAPAP